MSLPGSSETERKLTYLVDDQGKRQLKQVIKEEFKFK
jgi:hypothetical protein